MSRNSAQNSRLYSSRGTAQPKRSILLSPPITAAVCLSPRRSTWNRGTSLQRAENSCFTLLYLQRTATVRALLRFSDKIDFGERAPDARAVGNLGARPAFARRSLPGLEGSRLTSLPGLRLTCVPKQNFIVIKGSERGNLNLTPAGII